MHSFLQHPFVSHSFPLHLASCRSFLRSESRTRRKSKQNAACTVFPSGPSSLHTSTLSFSVFVCVYFSKQHLLHLLHLLLSIYPPIIPPISLSRQCDGGTYSILGSAPQPLVAATLKTHNRKCVICNTQFTDHPRYKLAVQIHMDRHFPNRFPCKGGCGTTGCGHIAATQKDLIYHRSSVAPQRTCPHCGNRYSTKFVLQTHIENVHNKHGQVVDYAVGAGYNVGFLASVTLWMAGQITTRGSMTNSARLFISDMMITSDLELEEKVAMGMDMPGPGTHTPDGKSHMHIVGSQNTAVHSPTVMA
jgi:hypothetical protein